MTCTEPAGRPSAAEVEHELATLMTAPPDDLASPSAPTTILPGVPTSSTAVLPSLPNPRRIAVRTVLAIAAALALVLVVVIAASDDQTTPPPPKPAYPTVSGPLGSDVSRLASDLP